MSVVAPVVLTVLFAAIGLWGRRNARSLVPVTFSDHRKERELRSLLRGARTCMILATVCAALGLTEVMTMAVSR